MQNGSITSKQAICLIILFIMGSSVVMGGNKELGQDSWIALLFAYVVSIPFLLMYANILKSYPGSDLFDITEILFGKIIGKFITLLYVWYALHLGALVLRNFSEFMTIVKYNETPPIILMISMLLICGYLVKSNISTIGKWGILTFSFVLFIVFFTIILFVKFMKFTEILPIFNHSLKEISAVTFSIFSFPFAEVVIFTGTGLFNNKKEEINKIFMWALTFGTLLVLVVILRNLFVIGAALGKVEYFSSYTTAAIFSIGSSITRIEGTIAFNFVLSGIVKISICLLAAAKGISKLFDITDYKYLVVPTCLIALFICQIVYNRATEMFVFLKTYSVYAIPFQIILPFIIWVTCKIKKINKKDNDINKVH